MTFSCLDKLKATAIVNSFETSKPFGDYAALAVLTDGAGVSFGANQFTHRSGALLAVMERYLANGGSVGAGRIRENLAIVRSRTPKAIASISGNAQFKAALKAAAITREMRAAQDAIAFEKFMRPAIKICGKMGFTMPLSLTVVYDSVVHGSWEKIRDRVGTAAVIGGRRTENEENLILAGCRSEREWITDYARKRHEWLESISRLRPTAHRTAFFLSQIASENWTLEMPVNVHGVRLTNEILRRLAETSDCLDAESVESRENPKQASEKTDVPAFIPTENPPVILGEPQIGAQPPLSSNQSSGLEKIGETLLVGGMKFDNAETAVRGMIRRSDAVKSLWTTIGGTAWQVVWAVGAFAAGLPAYVWLMVAVIGSAFALYYLHRQIALGKIREMRHLPDESKHGSE